MLITAATLIGYSVGLSLASGAIKRRCINKAADKIKEKVDELPSCTDEELEKIKKSETLKANVEYSVATALLGVAGAAASTAIICNFDAPKCACTHPAIDTKPQQPQLSQQPIQAVDGGVEPDPYDGTSTVTIGGVEVTTF